MVTFSWPWERTYRVRCPDGTERTVHKNIDDACPLYVQGWNADVSANIAGLDDLSAKAKAKYGTQIQGLLFGLNEQNQSLMMSFRTVYLAFMTNPCGNSGFFFREIEKLLDEQRRITALRIQIAALVQLAAASPEDTSQLALVLSEIAARLGGPAVAPAASLEIAETRDTAKRWAQGE